MERPVRTRRSAANLRSAGLAAACLVSLSLAACAQGPGWVNPWVPPPGQPEAFDDGWVDGCVNGYNDAGRDGYQLIAHKDMQRYLKDAEYKRGFDPGYAGCFDDEKRHPKIRPEGGTHSSP
jgi:hypothetical protein